MTKNGKQVKTLAFWAKIAAFMIFLWATCACVFLNGDDFMYASFAKQGIFANVTDYYFTGNGRYWINILDSALLSCDRVLFIVLNPFIIISFVLLLAKNIQWITAGESNRDNERRYASFAMVLFACLHVLCLRETVYWITGMMNYLFPAVVFLLATWSFLVLRANPGSSVWKRLLHCVICLFAASSVEQFALMFVGFCSLILLKDIITKKGARPILLIGYVFSLLGLAALLLAPGNFQRVDEQVRSSIVDNVWTLVHQNVGSAVAFPFVLMLSSCCCLLLKLLGKKRASLLFSFVPIGFSLMRIFPMLERAVVITALMIAITIELFYCLICVRKKWCEAKNFAIMFFVLGVCSQIMLLISEVWGYRCMLSMYLVYMLIIGICLSGFSKRDCAYILCLGIVGNLFPPALLVVLLARLLLKRNEKVTYAAMLSGTALATALALFFVFAGYFGNVRTHNTNIQNTKAAENNTVFLNELEDDIYSWYFIPMGDFHENYYRIYHSLPENVEIQYAEKDLPEQ